MSQGYGSKTLALLLYITSVRTYCTSYGVCNNYKFVPAPPGHTPLCAKPGSTFCEDVEQYPRQLIRNLIEKWGYDYNTLFSDESREDFQERKFVTLNTFFPRHHGHGSQTVIQPSISYGPINITTPFLDRRGYPERRYKIEPQFLTNALQQPSDYTQGTPFFNGGRSSAFGGTVQQANMQSFQWWARLKTSGYGSTRRKRQITSGSTLCPTRPAYIMPRAALNTRGNWMYTVNLNEVDERYTQLVRSETCITSQCSGLCTLPHGYSSRCQQQYVQKRLVALEGDGERLYTDVFWFPHCCICQITTNQT